MPSTDSKRPLKGILKVTTVDESLHTKYSTSTSSTLPVTFGKISMREYCTVLGDNPSCTRGPPISIGWQYKQGLVISLENYETNRGDRRSCMQMVIPREIREDILMEDCGFSRTEIAAAVRENMRTKQRRRRTVNNLGNYSKIEEAAESFSRKLKRLVSCNRKKDDFFDVMWYEEYRRATKAVAEEDAASQEEQLALKRDVTFQINQNERQCSRQNSESSEEDSIQDEIMNEDEDPKVNVSILYEGDMGAEPINHSCSLSKISAVESSASLEGILEKISGVHGK